MGISVARPRMKGWRCFSFAGLPKLDEMEGTTATARRQALVAEYVDWRQEAADAQISADTWYSAYTYM